MLPKLYFSYIRLKYQVWKLYWKVFKPKRPKVWREISYDLSDNDAVAIGILYGPEVVFNPDDYGVVAYKSARHVNAS